MVQRPHLRFRALATGQIRVPGSTRVFEPTNRPNKCRGRHLMAFCCAPSSSWAPRPWSATITHHDAPHLSLPMESFRNHPPHNLAVAGLTVLVVAAAVGMAEAERPSTG